MADPIARCVQVAPTSSMQQCMDAYGIEGEGEWINNSISSFAQFWSCGMVSNNLSVQTHDHDPHELMRCHALANEAAAVIGPVWPMFRSGSDPVTQRFLFVAQRNAKVPKRVTEKLIRVALGGTLHPDAQVMIEPFAEGTEWWQMVEEDARSYAGESPTDSTFDDLIVKWRDLMKWFSANSIAAPSFVRITDSKEASFTLGCVFPNFILGISDKGSLVGIASHIVE